MKFMNIRSFGAACYFSALVITGSVFAQSKQPPSIPEAVHVICLAEDRDALGIAAGLLDNDDWGTFLRYKSGQKLSANDEEVLRKITWPIQRMHAISLGTGFIVDESKMTVLTSYDLATSCIMNDGANATSRRQIAILSKDGLSAIRGVALGVNSKYTNSSTPIPKFICKSQDSSCSRTSIEEAQQKQLGNVLEYKKLREEVKYWVPDLVVLRLEAAATWATPVKFAAEDQVPAGASLRYSGFPSSLQTAGAGVSNSLLPAQRATPTVQPATFSRIVEIDNGADQIIADSRRVKSSWLELSGAAIERGNSGAPLFDPVTGSVLGLVIKDIEASKLQGGGKAVPVSQIKDYLTKASIGFSLAVAPIPEPQAAAAPTPPPAPVEAPPPQLNRFQTLKQQMLTTQGLLFAGLLTFLVGFGAWFVFRQRPTKVEGVLLEGNTDEPLRVAQTKPQFFATLRCAHGPLASQELFLPTASGRDSLTVGRDPAVCQVVFPDNTVEVSGVHCRFAYDTATHTLSVEDLQSSNGTYFNKRLLRQGERVRLQSNDMVALGRPDQNIFVITIN